MVKQAGAAWGMAGSRDACCCALGVVGCDVMHVTWLDTPPSARRLSIRVERPAKPNQRSEYIANQSWLEGAGTIISHRWDGPHG